MIANEEAPLIYPAEDPDIQPESDDIYKCFTPGKKRVILALVSWLGLLPVRNYPSFVLSVPQIAEELKSTGSVIDISISFALLMLAFGNLVTRASVRTVIHHFPDDYPLPLLGFLSLGVAVARSVPELIVWRMLQTFAASAGMAVGAAVIGDMCGATMGVFFAACCLGAAVSPLCGGVVAYYASWQAMQHALFLSAILAFAFMYAFLPEMAQAGTRGLENCLQDEVCTTPKCKWVWLNSLSSLGYLRSPNIMVVERFLLIPLSYTIGAHYNIKNEAVISAFFLSVGLGSLLRHPVGSPLAGYMSDRIIVKWQVKWNGIWLPEDSLRAAIPRLHVLAPLSIVCSSFIMEYMPRLSRIILNLFCLFVNGVGVHSLA
ncbi:hypothetical protein GLOTRDRAFT_44234 [Gloeophyllum trabeum ATCC 11539]|uniref:MFS general substrate transporter n=1 Tax=Gloeophyllum trabeum (strain ATCC 11539 / FP-39264 / Madison 617) TaxID=670483 RepID=S7Q2S7_GLOTA|nr:uncharacterized protein GLOTRDRAFT_44234 [Gloeophyllum trabeum ATCC 11539]EPQ54301.1 hypothetical protein GLOTRDRAFT_44234 [Gloeophyllum trabeum ATCC 11539]